MNHRGGEAKDQRMVLGIIVWQFREAHGTPAKGSY
jgi:hypothetical protein